MKKLLSCVSILAMATMPAFAESNASFPTGLEFGLGVSGSSGLNGKVKGTVLLGVAEDKDSALGKAKAEPGVAKFIEGKTIVKEIYVPGKIVNIVVK